MNGSQFTFICTQLAQLHNPFRADLHLHSTYSDGQHTLDDLLRRAAQAKLRVIALTDHDTLAGYQPLRDLATSATIEVVPGVEITCEADDREIHLLAYWVDVDHPLLNARLQWLRDGRRQRILEMGRRLFPAAASIDERVAAVPHTHSLGRRHVAGWLMAHRLAGSYHDAFTRVLAQAEVRQIPKRRLPLAEAIELVHQAGGICSYAHPPADISRDTLARYQHMGLDAVEAVYPWAKRSHGNGIRRLATELGLAISGGSDSHDATPPTRNVGSRAINQAELDKLRSLIRRPT